MEERLNLLGWICDPVERKDWRWWEKERESRELRWKKRVLKF